jgi:hypothetical protein
MSSVPMLGGYLIFLLIMGVLFDFEIKEHLLPVFGNFLESKNLQFWIFSIFNVK